MWTADSTARSYDAALTLDAFANRLRDEATLAYRRLLDRFGKRTQKLGHLHHTGTVRSSVGDDGVRTVEPSCECGALLGPWRDI